MKQDSNNCIADQIARMKMLDKQISIQTVHGVKEALDLSYRSKPKNTDLYALIEGSTDKDQVLKLSQELGELSDSVCKGRDIKDDIGDMLVVMINIAERNGVILSECLNKAWEDIKDRKGKMIDGVFVKESDL